MREKRMPLQTWITTLLLLIASQAPAAPLAFIKPVAADFALDGFVKEWAKQPPPYPCSPGVSAPVPARSG
jgi:hypothetical protein